MVGDYVPLILVPRFTSYVGAGTYETIALDVTAFASFNVGLWTGPIIGDPNSPTGTASFQTSHDAINWYTIIGGITADSAPKFTKIGFDFDRRWLRLVIELASSGTPPNNPVAVTCWCTGMLVTRTN